MLSRYVQARAARLQMPPGEMTGEPRQIQLNSVTCCEGTKIASAAGTLLTVPEQFVDWLRQFHRAGINIHTHCDGDATIDLFLDAVEQSIIEHPWLKHRHTVQRSQLTTSAQFRRMAKLGLCANIFAQSPLVMGEQHYELTVGPERANRMVACATALREGVPFSLHSDANVTPLGQLHTMWCARKASHGGLAR